MKINYLRHLAVVITTTLLLSSCASYQGTGITGSASLNSNNFRYAAKGVQGSITINRFLGLGGISRKAMVAEAKDALLAKVRLQDGQALANVTVDLKISYVFVIQTTRCTVSADIVEFTR
jgi:hypothetical protein